MRELEIQFKEHQAASPKGETNKSAICRACLVPISSASLGGDKDLSTCKPHTLLVIKETHRKPEEFIKQSMGLDKLGWKKLSKDYHDNRIEYRCQHLLTCIVCD